MPLIRIAVLAVVMTAFVGCASDAKRSALDALPADAAPVTAAADAIRYEIDTAGSEIRLLVYRDGPLAGFGHNHVITGNVHGELQVTDDVTASSFRLEIPVAELIVDDDAARAEAGRDFKEGLSDEARRRTRKNLLGPAVLDADNHPVIIIQSVAIEGARQNPHVLANVTLRGETRQLRIPVAVSEREDKITATAEFTLRQSDFGITPFRTMGGALRVADGVDVRVRLLARPRAIIRP